MKNFQSFETVNFAFHLLIGLTTSAFAHPLIDRYYDELQNTQPGYEWGFVGEQPYARLDPTSLVYQIDDPNASYLDPSIASMMPYDQPTVDINARKLPKESFLSDREFLNEISTLMLEKIKQNFESEKKLHPDSYYNDDRSGSEDPKLLNGVQSMLTEIVRKEISSDHDWENNAIDRVSGRSNDEASIDPRFLNGIRDLMFGLMNQRSDRAHANSTANSTKPVKPDGQKPYSSGFVLHPGPMPLVQTIQQAHLTEPMFYDGYFNNYPSPMSTSIFAIPSATPPPISAPLPTAYSFPGQESFYLQPMYGAPLSLSPNLLQVWPLTSEDEYKPMMPTLPASDDSTISNTPSSLKEESQKPKPIETNLTKSDIDPNFEQQKANAHLHGSPSGANVRGARGKDKKDGWNASYKPSKKTVSGRSMSEYEPTIERRRPTNNQPLPIVKKVLMPVSQFSGKHAAPLSGVVHKEQNKPRYKVMYHLQKTYVPISS